MRLISKSIGSSSSPTQDNLYVIKKAFYMFPDREQSFTLLSSSDILYYLMNKEIERKLYDPYWI
jgi:hypothetical protein